MAIATGTNITYGRVGNAEDVHDTIYDISPTETPVLTAAKRLKATATLHQWQVHSLAAAATNSQIEGDEATFASVAPTTMLGNYCNISRKTVVVSRTSDVVKKYGRGTEIGFIIKNQSKELKRDIELMLCGQQASTAGSATAARVSAGYRAMIANIRNCTGTATDGGTQPGAGAAGSWGLATDGTNVTFLEVDLKEALAAAWTDGGNPEMLVVNTKQKARIAAFAGATAFEGFSVGQARSAQGVVVAGVDLYISDKQAANEAAFAIAA